MDKAIITKSSEETQNFAAEFAKTIKPGEIICLYGDLGAGKTTFVQGLAKGLGIKQRIISPTFTIIREYGNFYHIDLYRVENITDIKNLGIEELFNNPENIIVIEWAERMKDLLPKKRIEIEFKPTTGSVSSREITIKSYE